MHFISLKLWKHNSWGTNSNLWNYLCICKWKLLI